MTALLLSVALALTPPPMIYSDQNTGLALREDGSIAVVRDGVDRGPVDLRSIAQLWIMSR